MPKGMRMFHENIWLCRPGVHRSSAGPTEDQLVLLRGCRPAFSPERTTPPASKPLGPLFSGILGFDVGFLAEAGGPAGSQRPHTLCSGECASHVRRASRGPLRGGFPRGPSSRPGRYPSTQDSPGTAGPAEGIPAGQSSASVLVAIPGPLLACCPRAASVPD